MNKTLLILAALLVFANASNCGNNCYNYSSSSSSSICPSCPCGTSPLMLNVSQFTTLYTDWKVQCIDCIARWSKGNAHAMGYDPVQNLWAMGLFRLSRQSCPNVDPCNPKAAVGCAHSLWQSSDWAEWGVDIGRLGCNQYCVTQDPVEV